MKAKLVIVSGQATKREVPLVRLPILIGRNRNAGLPIAHALVSRNHCQIYSLHGALVIRDLGSANGTRVNDELVNEQVLRPGDRLTVGPLTFAVNYDYAGEVPDLDILRMGGDDDVPAPFFEEAVEEAVAISDDDLIDDSSMDHPVKKPAAPEKIEKKPAPNVSAKPQASKPTAPPRPKTPAPATKSPFKKTPEKGAEKTGRGKPDDDATQQWDNADPNIMDLKLEDLLADSMVLKDKPAERSSKAPAEESDESFVRFEDSGVHIREDDSVHSRPVAERIDATSQTGLDEPAEVELLGGDAALELEDSEDFLLVEDSTIGSLADSGVGPPARRTFETPDLTLDSAIVDPDASSFDAVRLLTGTKPPDRDPRGEAVMDDDGKPVISFVAEGRAWERSGIGVEQLNDKKQPVDFLLRLQLPDAGKLRVGTPIRVAGIDVGMVSDLNWVATAGQLRAEALLNIQKKLGEVLREDFRIRVAETPEVFVAIESPGSSDKHLEHGQVVLPS